MDSWRVHKFGGSSVADAACIERVAAIVEDDPGPRLAVILSACRGVTDSLIALVTAAAGQEPDVADRLAEIERRHQELIAALLGGADAEECHDNLAADCRDIAGILQTAQLVRDASPALRDLTAGFGELWSTRIFTRYLRQRNRRPGIVQWLDARRVIEVERGPLGPIVQWRASHENLRREMAPDSRATLVVPGFVARDRHGVQTTLGRNGSDFSASIFGSLLDADEIHIWTDVDGVLSADPRLVPDATVIDSLSYHEAMELAYFGAKVIHPQTMAPAVETGHADFSRRRLEPSGQGDHQYRPRVADQR